MEATFHYEKRLRVKTHKLPKGVGDTVHMEGESSARPQDEEPTWLKKLYGKMRKAFCLQMDIQDRLYDAHKKEKFARRRQKAIKAMLELPVSSGSEDRITPREDWISAYSRWSSDDDATSSPPHTPFHRGAPRCQVPAGWENCEPWDV